MAFINEIYGYKKIFRDIEKATKKCVHLNGAIDYLYIYIQIELIHMWAMLFICIASTSSITID